MKLNAESYDSKPGASNLVIIHGLFGSASNFRSLAKKYAAFYNVHCLDLRNHGGSPHSDDVTYPLMAADVADFMDDHNIDSAHVLGHSMGGKTAMQLAIAHPKRIKRLVIADIAPVEYPQHHVTIFAGLNSVNFSQVKTRGEVEEGLKNYVEDAGIRSFLMTNLVRKEDGEFKWRVNTTALMNNYDNIRDPRVSGHPVRTTIQIPHQQGNRTVHSTSQNHGAVSKRQN